MILVVRRHGQSGSRVAVMRDQEAVAKRVSTTLFPAVGSLKPGFAARSRLPAAITRPRRGPAADRRRRRPSRPQSRSWPMRRSPTFVGRTVAIGRLQADCGFAIRAGPRARVGPCRLILGMPTATARCTGPVSEPTNRQLRRQSAASCRIVLGVAAIARRPLATTTWASARLGRQPTSRGSKCHGDRPGNLPGPRTARGSRALTATEHRHSGWRIVPLRAEFRLARLLRPLLRVSRKPILYCWVLLEP